MSATMVSVTVIDSDGTSDFAAPEGTTVAGLCAMLEIDLSLPSVRVSYADGRPLDGAAVLGRDLPAGSTIALSSRVLSAQQVNEASERQENQWLSPVLALLGYCFIVIGAVSSLCLLPMLAMRHSSVSLTPRMVRSGPLKSRRSRCGREARVPPCAALLPSSRFSLRARSVRGLPCCS